MEADRLRRIETLDRLERELGLVDLAMEQVDRGDLGAFDHTMAALATAAPPTAEDPDPR